MSFHFSFIAKDRARALAHLADLQQGGASQYSNVPEQVWGFVDLAINGIRHPGPVSVTAMGHLVTDDAQSYETSTCTIDVKPLGSQFVE